MVSSSDVAKAAGVSRTAVSRVLNGHLNAGIPELTRSRILQAARDLGYVANASAKALATGKTNRISVITDDPVSLFGQMSTTGRILRGIMEQSMVRGMDVLLSSKPSLDWQSQFEALRSGVSDGAILIDRPTDDPLSAALFDAGMPIVHVGERPQGVRHFVDCDNFEGGRVAGEHLLEVGCDSIFVLGDASNPVEGARADGIRHAAGASFEGQLQDPDEIHLLLRRRNRRLGLIGLNAQSAEVVFHYLYSAGLKPPRHYAALVFDDIGSTAKHDPTMTTMEPPLHQMGQSAVEILVRRLGSDPEAATSEIHPMSLRRRSSSSRL